MKLIIDIPKNAYDLLQGEGVDWLGAEHILDAVSNGTPLEESEDCVSRQAVLSMQYRINDIATFSTRGIVNVDDIENLPPVIPAQKIGQWIDTRSGQECSECGEIQYGYDNFRNYCANCGIKM